MKYCAKMLALALATPGTLMANSPMHAADDSASEPAFGDARTALEGFTPRAIYRLHTSSQSGIHMTLHFFPQNWEDHKWGVQGLLGYISSTPFPAGAPLYSCTIPGRFDFFSSLDPACEGQSQVGWAGYLGVIGYISMEALPGHRPLYRCYYHRAHPHHFDSHNSDCEGVPGANNDGLLGYVRE